MSLFGGRREDAPSARVNTPARLSSSHDTRSPGAGAGEQRMANIGKSISIKGDLTGNEDLVLEGKVEGKVELPNNQLTVGANGTVTAEIQAKTVVVVGKVSGNIHGMGLAASLGYGDPVLTELGGLTPKVRPEQI